ncbi:MiaB/RimO family radical SAM methylthiotransferase [Patescibacteria group bacterium]
MTYKPKTYHIKTFGCAANEVDSSTIVGILEAVGYQFEEDMEKANLVIINTCSVRQKSEDKVYGLGKIFHRMPNRPFVVLAGCMVGSVTGERRRYVFDELKNRTPWVNLYINPDQINELPTLLDKEFPQDFERKYPKGEHAYVNISYGCDNFCRFCVVPFARGGERSRTRKEILNEIKKLAKKGYKHITLCGQNVNSWDLETNEKFKIRAGSDQKLPFAGLLREVHEIEGVEKIDFISSNPFDFTEDLIQTLKLPKIDNYIHIAVQSGNNDVLKSMNRRHTIEDFIALINQVKKVRPDMKFGTDIIVGFPGETRAQFNDTVELFKQVPFQVAFISIYSARKGTPAAELYEDDVPLVEKKKRHAELMEVWKQTKKPS